jgi:hypothetical protein
MTDGAPSQELSPELKAAVKEFSDWWAEREKELDVARQVNRPLYHYTDMGGLQGIINSEQFWFTSVFHLNDPSELAYGVGVARQVIKLETRRGDAIIEELANRVEHILLHAPDVFGFFIASFSSESNDLGQWRAYADNGRGASIGLAPELFRVVLDQASLSVVEKTLASPVTYNLEDCQGNFERPIKRAVDIILRDAGKASSDAERARFLGDMAVALAPSLLVHAITTKHPAYENERETRLVLMNQHENFGRHVRTRTRGPHLIPFVQSPLPVRVPGNITRIIVGPAADDRAIEAVRALMRSHDLPINLVGKSLIPYTVQ